MLQLPFLLLLLWPIEVASKNAKQNGNAYAYGKKKEGYLQGVTEISSTQMHSLQISSKAFDVLTSASFPNSFKRASARKLTLNSHKTATEGRLNSSRGKILPTPTNKNGIGKKQTSQSESLYSTMLHSKTKESLKSPSFFTLEQSPKTLLQSYSLNVASIRPSSTRKTPTDSLLLNKDTADSSSMYFESQNLRDPLPFLPSPETTTQLVFSSAVQGNFQPPENRHSKELMHLFAPVSEDRVSDRMIVPSDSDMPSLNVRGPFSTAEFEASQVYDSNLQATAIGSLAVGFDVTDPFKSTMILSNSETHLQERPMHQNISSNSSEKLLRSNDRNGSDTFSVIKNPYGSLTSKKEEEPISTKLLKVTSSSVTSVLSTNMKEQNRALYSSWSKKIQPAINSGISSSFKKEDLSSAPSMIGPSFLTSYKNTELNNLYATGYSSFREEIRLSVNPNTPPVSKEKDSLSFTKVYKLTSSSSFVKSHGTANLKDTLYKAFQTQGSYFSSEISLSAESGAVISSSLQMMSPSLTTANSGTTKLTTVAFWTKSLRSLEWQMESNRKTRVDYTSLFEGILPSSKLNVPPASKAEKIPTVNDVLKFATSAETSTLSTKLNDQTRAGDSFLLENGPLSSSLDTLSAFKIKETPMLTGLLLTKSRSQQRFDQTALPESRHSLLKQDIPSVFKTPESTEESTEMPLYAKVIFYSSSHSSFLHSGSPGSIFNGNENSTAFINSRGTSRNASFKANDTVITSKNAMCFFDKCNDNCTLILHSLLHSHGKLMSFLKNYSHVVCSDANGETLLRQAFLPMNNNTFCGCMIQRASQQQQMNAFQQCYDSMQCSFLGEFLIPRMVNLVTTSVVNTASLLLIKKPKESFLFTFFVTDVPLAGLVSTVAPNLIQILSGNVKRNIFWCTAITVTPFFSFDIWLLGLLYVSLLLSAQETTRRYLLGFSTMFKTSIVIFSVLPCILIINYSVAPCYTEEKVVSEIQFTIFYIVATFIMLGSIILQITANSTCVMASNTVAPAAGDEYQMRTYNRSDGKETETQPRGLTDVVHLRYELHISRNVSNILLTIFFVCWLPFLCVEGKQFLSSGVVSETAVLVCQQIGYSMGTLAPCITIFAYFYTVRKSPEVQELN